MSLSRSTAKNPLPGSQGKRMDAAEPGDRFLPRKINDKGPGTSVRHCAGLFAKAISFLGSSCLQRGLAEFEVICNSKKRIHFTGTSLIYAMLFF